MKPYHRSPWLAVSVPPVVSTALCATAAAFLLHCGLDVAGLDGPPAGTPSSSSSGTGIGSSGGQGGAGTTSSSAAEGGGGAGSTTSNTSSESSSTGAGSPTGAGGGPAGPIIWHSYDVLTADLIAPDEGKSKDSEAKLEAYEAAGTKTDELVKHARDLSVYTPGKMPLDKDNVDHKVEDYRTSSGGGGQFDLMYLGKSSVGRGCDKGEVPMLMLCGQSDLQVHPDDPNKPVVVAFNVKIKGDYVLSDFAVRRVFATIPPTAGASVKTCIQPASDVGNCSPGEVALSADNRAWVTGAGAKFDNLQIGDRVLFVVSCKDTCDYDSMEIAWTLTATPKP